MSDLVATLHATFGSRLLEQEPMSRHTNFRIGGPARWYVDVRTEHELVAAAAAARDAGVQWLVLGGGSNTLIADAGFDGLIMQMAMRDVVVDGTRVVASAGAITAGVARAAADAGLAGFEWAISLPGTIGGAVYGNAGCFGGEMQDVVEEVVVAEMQNAECRMQKFRNAQCRFRYRHSIFKERPELIVMCATLLLRRDDPAAIRGRMDAMLAKRKATQPHDRPSAGCLFKNIDVERLDDAARAGLDAGIGGSWREAVRVGRLPTGWLIEQLGLKGHRFGNAAVSELHGNFFLNAGGATADDVRALAEDITARVRTACGVTLEPEVRFIGFT